MARIASRAVTVSLGVALIAGAAGRAGADSPGQDASAQHAAEEANLESNAPRAGLTLSAAVGGSFALGFGIDDSVGRGGALSLRVGHVMTPSSVLLFELEGASQFHKTSMTNVVHNDDVHLLVGAQYYTNASFWIRGGAGYGMYTLVQAADTKHLAGAATVFGLGLDILRRHYFVLGVEAFVTGTVNRDGLITSSALCLGASYY